MLVIVSCKCSTNWLDWCGGAAVANCEFITLLFCWQGIASGFADDIIYFFFHDDFMFIACNWQTKTLYIYVVWSLEFTSGNARVGEYSHAILKLKRVYAGDLKNCFLEYFVSYSHEDHWELFAREREREALQNSTEYILFFNTMLLTCIQRNFICHFVSIFFFFFLNISYVRWCWWDSRGEITYSVRSWIKFYHALLVCLRYNRYSIIIIVFIFYFSQI